MVTSLFANNGKDAFVDNVQLLYCSFSVRIFEVAQNLWHANSLYSTYYSKVTWQSLKTQGAGFYIFESPELESVISGLIDCSRKKLIQQMGRNFCVLLRLFYPAPQLKIEMHTSFQHFDRA